MYKPEMRVARRRSGKKTKGGIFMKNNKGFENFFYSKCDAARVEIRNVCQEHPELSERKSWLNTLGKTMRAYIDGASAAGAITANDKAFYQMEVYGLLNDLEELI